MNYESHCLHCGEALTGRQVRTCSPRCRKALQRPPRPLQPCRLCGEPFQPVGPGRRSVCDYETEADDRCRDLQDDAEDAQAARTAALSAAECQGPACGLPVPYKGRGRPRRFCSARCRTRAYRQAARS